MDHSTNNEPIIMSLSPMMHQGGTRKFKQRRVSFKNFKKAMGASFSSVKTAATSLMGSVEESHINEQDIDDGSVLPWEDLQDSFVMNSGYSTITRQQQQQGSSRDDDDGDDCCSESSLDLGDLQDYDEDDDHFLEPYESFHASYDLGASLGQGAFGSVHRCQPKGHSPSHHNGSSGSSSFAVKAVPTEIYDFDEMEILQDLQDCPHVVQVKEVFHHSDNSYIVMEEIEGGTCFERIAQKECYTEEEAKALFKTLLETIQYCHMRGIAHCDIKPENVMLVSKDDDTKMKLVDFGLAKRFRREDGSEQPLVDMVGSAEYAAPEVFNRSPGDDNDEDDADNGYDERADIWSAGVMLYVLLAGYAPFEADTTDEMIKVVGRGKFKFHKRYWQHISREAKTLIATMMQVNPDNRCTLDEALASPWFQQE